MASNVIDFAKQFAPWLTLGLGVLMGGLRTAWSFVYEHTIGYAMTRISLSLTVEDLGVCWQTPVSRKNAFLSP